MRLFMKRAGNACSFFIDRIHAFPYGQTWTYRQQAESIGKPKAVRAIGMANHRNPIPIFIPCHRVIGADGSLTGYGGGLEIKQSLLDLERLTVEKQREAEMAKAAQKGQ